MVQASTINKVIKFLTVGNTDGSIKVTGRPCGGYQHVVKISNGREFQVADGHLGLT